LRQEALVLYPERTFATADHNTPTINQHLPVEDPLSANQLKALETNSAKYGISHWGLETLKTVSYT
jgi:3-isopropylmalate/(R)-2-methylmalate dehydratase large subunit